MMVSTHWGTLFGGINSFNYACARALADFLPSTAVHVVTITGNPRLEKQEASPDNLKLHIISDEIDTTFAMTGQFNEPSRLKAIERINEIAEKFDKVWVIGHDVYTGFIACDVSREINSKKSGSAKCVIFRHVDFTAYQPLLRGVAPEKSAEKMKLQMELIKTAGHVFAIGPILYANTKHLAKSITDLTPGFRLRDQKVRTDVISLGIFGRLGESDDAVKQASVGIHGFARMMAKVYSDNNLRRNKFWRDARLTLVGVPNEQGIKRKSEIQALVGAAINVQTHDYVDSPIEALQLLDDRNVNIGVFPSLRESFGLVASEFIGLGIPTIISERTGIYRWLEETFGGEALGCITRFSGRGPIESGKPHEEDINQMSELLFEVSHNLQMKVRDAAALQKKVSPHDWRSTARQIALDLGLTEETTVEAVEQWSQQAAELQLSFGSRVSRTIAEVRIKELVREAESAVSLARYRLAESRLSDLRLVGVQIDGNKQLQRVQADIFLRSGHYQRAIAIVEKTSRLSPSLSNGDDFDSMDVSLEHIRNVALRDLGRYQDANVHARSLVKWAGILLERDGGTEEARERHQSTLASSLRKLARCDAFIGDFPMARASLASVESLDLLAKNTSHIGKNSFALGEIARHAGEFEAAITFYVKSIGISELVGDLDLYTWSCLCVSDAHFMLGNTEVARSFIELASSAIKLFGEDLPVERSHIDLSELAVAIALTGMDGEAERSSNIIKTYGDRGVEWVAGYVSGLTRNRRAPFAKRF